MSKRIVLSGEFAFSDEQRKRLDSLGEVVQLDEVSSRQQWLAQVEGADVICSWGDYVLDNARSLKNVLVTYPYTELGAFDSKDLASRGVYIANAKGGNRKSIAEWAIFMILSMYRQFPRFLRTTQQYDFTPTDSLEGQKVLVVGHGTIGSEIGERCESFGMQVDYFNRGDDLLEKTRDADLVINALNCNSSSRNLLDAQYFQNMKKGAFYLAFSRPFTYDVDGLIQAIEDGVIAAAAIDCDPEPLFDVSNEFYQKCLSNEKILVTPHVAGVTRQASKNGIEIMVQNIEQYLNGTPQNVIEK